MFLELKNTTFQSIASKILHFVTPVVLVIDLPHVKKGIFVNLIFFAVYEIFNTSYIQNIYT